MNAAKENAQQSHESPIGTSKARVNNDWEAQTQEKNGEPAAAPVCSKSHRDPPSLCAMLPLAPEGHTVLEMNQPLKSIHKSRRRVKTTKGSSESSAGDLCYAILLACLFCQPADCLLAWLGAFGRCTWWLCSSLCGCEPAVLQSVRDGIRRCGVCGCCDRCSPCDCPICDICLQANECMDLAMEISQLLNH